MKRIVYSSLALAALCLFAVAVSSAEPWTPPAPPYNFVCPGTTPTPNGFAVAMNYWDNCPTSTDTYVVGANSVVMDEQHNDCFGYADKHLWKFSADGGATPAWFENCSMFEFCSDVTVTGDGNGEAGIELSPWWSQGDGQFMANYGSGEIAVFGGRLPFYSFTAAYGLHYVKGTTISMKIAYNPRSLDASYPGEVKYVCYVGGVLYDSGWLSYDMGNPNPGEGDVHGLYGNLSLSTIGGYFQPQCGAGADWNAQAKFTGICFNPIPTPAKTTTWGKLKSIYR